MKRIASFLLLVALAASLLLSGAVAEEQTPIRIGVLAT